MPVAAIVAWWGTAMLRGHVGPDELTDALSDEHVAQVVVGGGTLVAALRDSGPRGIAAVFPEPGDLTGLAGPAAFNAAAVEAGSAVLAVEGGLGLVPTEVGRAIEWTPYPALRRMPPDLGEADRHLRGTLPRVADRLARLDVARWHPDVADELQSLRGAAPLTAPPGVPVQAADLAGRALRLWTVADLALVDDGAAVSASEAAARRDAVLPLARAARHALSAACSPDGWPPEPDAAAR